MSPDTWNAILSVVLTGVLGALAWLANTVVTNKRNIAEIRSALDVAQLTDELRAVHGRVTRCNEGLARLEGQITAAETQVQMLNQHLLDRKP